MTTIYDRTRARGEPGALGLDDPWREQAACRHPAALDIDADAWFGNGRALAERDAVETAKAVCEDCPVRIACLDYAVKTKQPWGIWGGTTPAERGTDY